MELKIIIILLAAAMVLAFLEIITPIFGLLALGAMICATAAVVIGFMYAAWLGWILLVVVLILTPVYLTLLVKLLPKTPLGKHLFLGKKPQNLPGEGTPEAAQFDQYVGREAIADSNLRPAGLVKIDGKRIPANAQQGIIKKGATVKIIRADSMNVVVEEV